MIDTAQVVILLVVIILTGLLVVLGVQIYFILKDLRKTLNKANKVLDDTSVITESVSGPISSVSNLSAGFKLGAAVLKMLKKRKNILKELVEDDE